jgi:hypothetical protein
MIDLKMKTKPKREKGKKEKADNQPRMRVAV